MNRQKNFKPLVCILGVMLLAVSMQTAAGRTENVGKNNPFKAITVNQPADSKVVTARRVILSQEDAAPELFAQSITLKFLTANKLAEVFSGMLSPYGLIATEDNTNSLIITDTQERLDKIFSEIKKIDKAPVQFVIEVVIADVQLTDEMDIGLNWDILSDEIYDISYRQNLTGRLGSTIDSAANIGNASAFNTTGSGGDFAIVSGSVRNVIHALQQKKNMEILASPKLMVLSGQSASIETVEEIPYIEQTSTGYGGNYASTEFKDVGIKLHVTATMTDGDLILLKVVSEQSMNTGVFGLDNIPIIDTRRAETTLLLKDGQIVAMGGLRQKNITKSRDQIPILGDLPLIGFLFGRDRTDVRISELIVLISPHIYKGQQLDSEHLAKFEELKNQPMLKLPINTDD